MLFGRRSSSAALSTSGLIQTHFVSLCGDNGLGAVPAASVLATIGACDFVGTIGVGLAAASDRYDNRKLLFWYYGLRGLSLFWLPHSTFTVIGLSLFAVFYGARLGGHAVPPTVRLTSAAFDKQQAAPMIFGWIFAGRDQLGVARWPRLRRRADPHRDAVVQPWRWHTRPASPASWRPSPSSWCGDPKPRQDDLRSRWTRGSTDDEAGAGRNLSASGRH